MTEVDPIAFGRMQAELAQTRAEMAELKDAVKELTEMLHQARGGWKTTVAIGGVLLGLGAFSSKILTFLGWR